MVPDCTFDCRVVAINCQGSMSEPGGVLRFATLARDQSRENTGPRSADSVFTIECTGDICVGDTLLITERLFAKEADGFSTSGGGSVAAGASISGRSKATAAKGASGASRAGALNNSTVRMEMSVSSAHSEGYLPPGAFIGERTIACTVVRDNYRTSRDAVGAQGLVVGDKRFAKGRKLWLEVMWLQASNDACKPYELKVSGGCPYSHTHTYI